MSFASLPDSVREVAERELTRKQLEVWKLSLNGVGTRRIAILVRRSRGTVADHLREADRKLLQAGVRHTTKGDWYVESEVAA